MLSRNCNPGDILITQKLLPKQIKCSEDAKNANIKLEEKHYQREIEIEEIKKKFYLIAYQNVRSLKKHMADIKDFPELFNCDVFCAAETWIKQSDDLTSYHLKKFHHHSNSYGKGKGLFIYYKMGEILQDITTKFLQITVMQYHNLLIIFIYRSKYCDLSEFLLHLLQIHAKFSNPLKIIVGDFNFNASENNCITHYLNSMNYIQHVNLPTHIKGNILDHFYTTKFNLNCFVNVKPTYFSDHCLLLGHFNMFNDSSMLEI